MKFEKHFPSERLKPFVKHFAISENETTAEYKVFPSTGPVIGFQYSGRISLLLDKEDLLLNSAGITGISESYKVFKSSAGTRTLLVYFTETGLAHFASSPASELFNLSISLDEIFHKDAVEKVESRLREAITDIQRIKVVEQFLLSQLKEIKADRLVVEAVRLIYQSKGLIRISDIHEKLFISQSPFEKRFKKTVGTTAKKFASIVRFNTVLANLDNEKSLTEICYENGFFDQAHFIKDFRLHTGDSPENFRRLR